MRPTAGEFDEPHPVYPGLFSPLDLGGYRLRNRLVHASITTRYVQGGRVTERLIEYHRQRARGGASLLVTEPLNLLPRQRNLHKVMVLEMANRAALVDWATAVRTEGAHLLGQVQDPGRGRHQSGRSPDAIGPSALPDDLSWTVPHALDTDEVIQMIKDFAAAALILRDCGFSGVEISAGHGHLFHQFLAARSNHRRDRFGGDLPGRSRLLTELCLALRKACGQAFIIGVKLPGEDGMVDGIDLPTAASITALVHATGCVDYLTWCWGSHSHTLGWHLPDRHGPRVPYVERIAALARHAPGVAIGALGLITDPSEAERLVRDGLADLIMLGRPLVTDPAWALKAASAREAEIRHCVACNTCWGALSAGEPLACDNNPRVGSADECDWRPAPARSRRRLVVVGAGPAGLEAAWVAAARGHEVTVFCASPEVGGKTRLHAALPGGAGLGSVYAYQRNRANFFGVRFEFGVQAELTDILTLQPDVVVLATGATPAAPAWLPEPWRDSEHFADVRRVAAKYLGRRSSEPGTTGRSAESGTAVIYDHDHTSFTYATALLLARYHTQVMVVTPREGVAAEESLVNRQGIQQRLAKFGVGVVAWHEVIFDDGLLAGSLGLRDVRGLGEHRIEDLALICHATPRLPNDQLLEPLRSAGISVRTIGDVYAPRSLRVATAEGHDCGMSV